MTSVGITPQFRCTHAPSRHRPRVFGALAFPLLFILAAIPVGACVQAASVALAEFVRDSSWLPRYAEAAALGIFGAGLARWTMTSALTLLGVRGRCAILLAGLAGLVGCVNGVFAGLEQVYDWSNSSGYLAFTLDSTVGLLGTTLGTILHLINHLQGGHEYAGQVSQRQNLFVYDAGFGFGKLAFTQGNVVSNLNGRQHLVGHESLHVWQSRAFGPLFQLVYAIWCAGGVLLALTAATAGYGTPADNVADFAYRSNPWELWAKTSGSA